MSEYCALDCRITHELWKALAPHKWSQKSLELEHRLAEICFRIGNAGWHFNTSAAGELYANLAQERADLEQELKELFPPWTVEEEFIPARNNKTRGYIAGKPFRQNQDGRVQSVVPPAHRVLSPRKIQVEAEGVHTVRRS